MQSASVVTRLARRRVLAAVTHAPIRNFASSSSVFKPTTTSTSPLATHPTSEPRHSDAYPNAPSSPASHTANTPRYVDARPDPLNTSYDIPSGPYASTAPYAHTHVAESSSATVDLPASSISKADLDAFEPSSTSASPAHPVTTQRVPRVPLAPHPSTEASSRASTEYAENPSSAVRNTSSPGLMEAAKEGGLGIMESEGGVMYPERELADRNPPPLSEEAEEISKAGVKEAWKLRK